jgi:hypothetical protein
MWNEKCGIEFDMKDETIKGKGRDTLRQVEIKMREMIILTLLMMTYTYSHADSAKYYRSVSTKGIKEFVLQGPVSPYMADRVNCFRITSDTLGRIVEVVYLKDGKPAIHPTFHYGRLTIKCSDTSEVWQMLDLNDKPSFPRPEMASLVYYFSQEGVPREKINYGAADNVIEDSAGVARYLFIPDASLRIARMLRTNIKGDTIVDFNGVYEDRFTYDEEGNIAKWAYYSQDGRLTKSNQGVAFTRFEYDHVGNVSQIGFYDEDSRLVLNNEFDWARSRMKYTEYGQISSLANFRPDVSISGDTGAISMYTTMSYDDSGNRILTCVRQFIGGVAQNEVETHYDENGVVTKAVYNFFVNEKSDLAKAVVEYKNGAEVKRTYIDKYGNIR